MDNSEKHQPSNNRDTQDADHVGEAADGDGSSDASQSVTRSLTEILLNDGDGDLLVQNTNRGGGSGVLRLLGSLNTHAIGACREDERLKPLLKLNACSSVAEDRLLGEISQHFETSEVGLLATCLCMPLVSVRVGKVTKQGTILTPTSSRGNLSLILLPTSDLRISFNGDDGSVERLVTISTESDCTSIKIEQIAEDRSGRSFLIKVSETEISYFWCSEKSKLLGDELLRKMNELIVTKPSLAELTGISELRLNCLATKVRSYLAGSFTNRTQASKIVGLNEPFDPPELCDPRSSSSGHKQSSPRSCNVSGSRSNLISLSPRPSSFKEVLHKSPSLFKTTARGKLRRREDKCALSSPESPTFNCFSETIKLPNRSNNPLSTLKLLDLLGKSTYQPPSAPKVPSTSSSYFSPHYCWCPPIASTLQLTLKNSQRPIISSLSESLSLPPLPPITSISCSRSSSLSEIPPLDFQTFLSEPSVILPTSQTIPTFTPLICDPIVHIPVIDVCSSGQGYLVSAGPTVPAASPFYNANSLLPSTESVLEKGARETLRMLINSSTHQNTQLLPSVLSGNGNNGKQDNMDFMGSRGLYCGTIDVESITKSISAMGIVSIFEKSNSKGDVGVDDAVDDGREMTPTYGSSGGCNEDTD